MPICVWSPWLAAAAVGTGNEAAAVLTNTMCLSAGRQVMVVWIMAAVNLLECLLLSSKVAYML